MRTPRTPKNAHAAQLVPIESLKPYPGNARTHDLDVIRESLRVNTQYRPIVVRTRTRHVLAGNGTLEAAKAEGWSEIWATFIDCDAKAARRINLVDNRANDLAGWDEQLLAAQLGDLPGVEGTGWSERELVSFVARVNGPGEDTEPIEPPKKPKTKVGDVWVLGEHRLLCGDATKDVDRLMGDKSADVLITDPPYGVNLGKHRGATDDVRRGHVLVKKGYASYDDTPENFVAVIAPAIESALARTDRGLVWTAGHMAWHLPQPQAVGGVFLPAALGRTCWGFASFQHALLYGNAPDLQRGAKAIGIRSTALPGDVGHPTAKPLEWMEWATDLASRPGEVILEPFAGSGTTLIACENLSRRCYAMEIDPGYCDVIVDRWERHTGRKATRGK